MRDAILVINSGSSSIKFAVYCQADTMLPERQLSGQIGDIGGESYFRVNRSAKVQIITESVSARDHEQALSVILDWLSSNLSDLKLIAAGHRVVHGGNDFTEAVLIDELVMSVLHKLIPLAPLHQPHALHAIKALRAQQPEMLHVASFDTAFHASMPWYEKQFALPQILQQQGIRRYGFHGLSYEYIAAVLPDYLTNCNDGRVVVAHLGHGASMCALKQRRSIATTMSFTPLDGLPMGRRSGAIDPAVVLYLLQIGHSENEISDILHQQSGLLGLSGLSDDMQTLLSSSQVSAKQAVEYYCYRISRELASLAAALQGLDALVFTGGIGEHAAQVRSRICQTSSWLGIAIDEAANAENVNDIGKQDSRVAIRVIPTDEEYMIAKHTFAKIGLA